MEQLVSERNELAMARVLLVGFILFGTIVIVLNRLRSFNTLRIRNNFIWIVVYLNYLITTQLSVI